jgi:hypothetical protein
MAGDIFLVFLVTNSLSPMVINENTPYQGVCPTKTPAKCRVFYNGKSYRLSLFPFTSEGGGINDLSVLHKYKSKLNLNINL